MPNLRPFSDPGRRIDFCGRMDPDGHPHGILDGASRSFARCAVLQSGLELVS